MWLWKFGNPCSMYWYFVERPMLYDPIPFIGVENYDKLFEDLSELIASTCKYYKEKSPDSNI
jgi:hypothetical protein